MKPILDMLKNYIFSNSARFHMPGHKGVSSEKLFENVFPCDITELDFSDNLLHPDGVIQQSQSYCASLWNAEKCFFVTCGATAGVLSLVFAAEGAVLAERASHVSLFNGLSLSGKKTYLLNNRLSDGMFLPVSANDVEFALEKNPDIKTVFLTSPNYYGKCCDLKKIADVCKNRGAKLFVDSAHGAHFAFSSLLPECAAVYADACVVSAHKTMPALTQAAAVLCKAEAAEKIKNFLNIFNSSSPSYPIMASIEYACGEFEKIKLNGADKKLFDLIEKLKKSAGHVTFENNDDFTRIVAKVGDGEKAFEFLKSKGIFCEFFDVNRVVAIVSLAEKEENIKRLFEAFAQMPCFETKHGADIVFEKVTQADFSDRGKSSYLPLNEAEGKICAESAGLYPPCVPLFVKGEKIHDAEKLFCQKDTFGLKDGKIKVWL